MVDFIEVRIQPRYTARPDSIIREVRIKVKISGREEYTVTELMEDSDFQSRFGWMMERVKREITKITNPCSC